MTANPGTMVDQVARAICCPDGVCRVEEMAKREGGKYITTVPCHALGLKTEARAAIEALRKPNNRMLKAACAAMSPGKRPTKARVSEKAKHGIRYRAMIDAALAEGK